MDRSRCVTARATERQLPEENISLKDVEGRLNDETYIYALITTAIVEHRGIPADGVFSSCATDPRA